jgi:trigger factor
LQLGRAPDIPDGAKARRKGGRLIVKVSTQELESSQVLLEIEVDPPRVERAVDQAYRRFANRLNVPGFRRGKAPRPIVERMVGRESLLEDAIEHLVPEVYQEAIGEAGLRPIEQASVEVVETEPLRIKATVPVRPAVQLGEYRLLRRELSVAEVTEEQVQGVLDQLRDEHATWVPVERAVQSGDRIAMDVHGTAGDEVISDRQDVEFVVDPESQRPLPGFAAQLVGMQAGESKEFTLRAPDDYEDPDLAGKDATFKVTVHWVKEKHLPDLDDAFASTVGSFGTLAELRERIERELKDRAEATARRELQEGVVEAVVGAAQLELPPQAIEREAERRRERLANTLAQRGLSLEQYQQLASKSAADMDEEFRTGARRDLTRELVLDAIADAEAIEVSDDEIETEIREAAGTGPDAARLRKTFARPEARARLANMIRERKAVERLVALATEGTASTESATPAAAAAEEPSHA